MPSLSSSKPRRRTSTYILALVGFILSCYAVHVEYKMEHINEVKELQQQGQGRQLEDTPNEGEGGVQSDASPPSVVGVGGDEDLDLEFKALCDIEAIGASCSIVFTLPVGRLLSYFGIVPHGHVLDVPNALLGVIYYTYILVLSSFMPGIITYGFVCGAFASSIFLAYQLTFVIVELCILCWSTHVINTMLFYHFIINPLPTTNKSTKSA